MHTLQNEGKAVAKSLQRFLEKHTEIGGSAQRYDSDISETFASFPHIDLYLWYNYRDISKHHGRPTFTEQHVTRLATLIDAELAVLVEFTQSLTRQIPNTEVILSRFDAGRCVFVLHRTDKK